MLLGYKACHQIFKLPCIFKNFSQCSLLADPNSGETRYILHLFVLKGAKIHA